MTPELEGDEEDFLAQQFNEVLNIVKESQKEQSGESSLQNGHGVISSPNRHAAQENGVDLSRELSFSSPRLARKTGLKMQKATIIRETSPAKSRTFDPFGYGKWKKVVNEIDPIAQKPSTSAENRFNAQPIVQKSTRMTIFAERVVPPSPEKRPYSNRKLPASRIWIPPESSGKKQLPGGMKPVVPLYPYFEIPYEFKKLGKASRQIGAKEILKRILLEPEFASIRNELQKLSMNLDDMAQKLNAFTYFSLINEDLNNDDPIDRSCKMFIGQKGKGKTRMCEIQFSENFRGDDRLKKNVTVMLSNDFSYTQANVLNINYKSVVVSISEDDETDQFLSEQECDMYANVNTFVYGNQLRAIDLFLEHNLEYLAFPQPEFVEPYKQFLMRQKFEISTNQRFSTILGLNEGQIEAIQTIVRAEHGNWPFILFGPPGTGKTTTLIETVRLLVDEYFAINNRILICTPSNAAADKITRDIIKRNFLDKSSILRLMSRSADIRNYTGEIQEVVCIA
uniref:DNA2/NAM7 helicase helicase domain-containing protein n=1 Tax=Acrobeloides nanus TaxID=290746 RepID=A0A914CQA5_9BILA